jgi:hypothetical protein
MGLLVILFQSQKVLKIYLILMYEQIQIQFTIHYLHL